jgi:hypothetical protein
MARPFLFFGDKRPKLESELCAKNLKRLIQLGNPEITRQARSKLNTNEQSEMNN